MSDMGEHQIAAGLQQKDTTFTKIFVGGLPYHTTDKSLRQFFEAFGEIEEAVVITDRQTGKSRGYGFVTMADREAAERAVKDANPIIDGRKANVNLAYLGAKPRINAQNDYHHTTCTLLHTCLLLACYCLLTQPCPLQPRQQRQLQQQLLPILSTIMQLPSLRSTATGSIRPIPSQWQPLALQQLWQQLLVVMEVLHTSLRQLMPIPYSSLSLPELQRIFQCLTLLNPRKLECSDYH